MDDSPYLEFCETSHFTRNVEKLLKFSEYQELQQTLIDNPAAGSIMRGTGGFRKLRFGTSNSGKRGGIRVIYYWFDNWGRIYLTYIYSKSKQEKLTPDQKKALKQLASQLKAEPVPVRNS